MNAPPITTSKHWNIIIKERIEQHPEISAVSEFIHFGCTSEDINNLAHGLMLTEGRDQVLVPMLETLINSIQQLLPK